jgi:hypothetical protein
MRRRGRWEEEEEEEEEAKRKHNEVGREDGVHEKDDDRYRRK